MTRRLDDERKKILRKKTISHLKTMIDANIKTEKKKDFRDYKSYSDHVSSKMMKLNAEHNKDAEWAKPYAEKNKFGVKSELEQIQDHPIKHCIRAMRSENPEERRQAKMIIDAHGADMISHIEDKQNKLKTLMDTEYNPKFSRSPIAHIQVNRELWNHTKNILKGFMKYE